VIEVLSHRSSGQNKTKYKLKWSRPDPDTGDPTTFETLNDIKRNNMRGGEVAVNKYKRDHPRAKFID